MIFVTGDTHGQIDIDKITMKKWPEQKNLTKDDYLIVLGDFGLFWQRDKTHKYLYDFYQSRKYTVLWVDGNHENHDWINSMPISQWNGGEVNRDGNIIHLRRGQIYGINGYSFFSLGGAMSVDKEHRIENVSWWKHEEVNYCEQETALDNLMKNCWRVDYVLTHAAPRHILLPMFNHKEYKGKSTTEKFLEYIANETDFSHWYFGHYHKDIDYGRYHCLYDRIIKLEV